MKSKSLGVAVLLLMSVGVSAQKEVDDKGCKDHALTNRMPGYYIYRCEDLDFDQARFGHGVAGNQKTETVEGPVYWRSYYPKEGTKPAGALQIARNFQNAIKAAGGTVMGDYNGGGVAFGSSYENPDSEYATTLKLTKAGKEIWVGVAAGWGKYILVIAEREAMQQDIVAKDWFDKLSKVGFVAIYINFATGSAAIKPESNGDLDQMAQMLKSNATLKVEVGGHTDNVGNAASNQTLSEARAKSVMDALVKRGIAATRLTAKGYGPTVPIADNRLEEGRALNRRVELAKKS